MSALRIILAACAFLFCVPVSSVALLDGHYQVTNLVLTQDDGDRPRGFNNTGLYIAADSRHVRIVGAFRGYPIRRSAIVERTIGDTLVLRDAEQAASVYKFHIRNNIVTGRHSIMHENGERQVINSKATIRKMSREEVDRLRFLFSF